MSRERSEPGATRPPRPKRRTLPVLDKPTPEALLEGVLALGRELHLGLDARSIAARFLRTIEDLFPGRAVAIRLESIADGSSRTTERHAVLSKGAELGAAAMRGPIVVKRSSLAKTGLSQSVVAASVAGGRMRLADVVEPAIEGAQAGFSIPLVAGGELYGVLDVAYPYGVGSDMPLVDSDERTLIPIANQLSVALRNFRLHAEAEVLRDYLGKLVDHASVLLIAVDPTWRITVANRAIERLMGFRHEEVIGKDVRDLIPGDARHRLMAVFARALGGQEATIDLELPTPNGPVGTVWQVAAIGPRDRVEAIVAVGQDVTRLKSLEKQVIQAEKLATLGQLAAGVVHELNNPLTSIIVYADFLLKKVEKAQPLEPPDVEKLRRILEGAERILNLSRDLVSYAKPANEHLDVLQMNDIVQQSLSFCEHVVRKSSVKLVVDLADELPPLYAVRGQLQQVVINLVTNAVHALPQGQGRVQIRTYPIEPGHIGLAITDTGIGIKKDHLDRIFEPFFTTKTDGKGTGLGLSIVKNIVERHQGSISCKSTPGAGTTFTIVLPTHHRPQE